MDFQWDSGAKLTFFKNTLRTRRFSTHFFDDFVNVATFEPQKSQKLTFFGHR